MLFGFVLGLTLLLTVSSHNVHTRPVRLVDRGLQDNRNHKTRSRDIAGLLRPSLRKRAGSPKVEDPDAFHERSVRSRTDRRPDTFDFSRHPRKTLVRFILAGSVSDRVDSKPLFLTQIGCLDDESKGAEDHNNHRLLCTDRLLQDPNIARPCQSFFAHRAAPSNFDSVDSEDPDRTNALIAVTVSGDTSRKLGWNFTQAVVTGQRSPAKITWIDKVDPDEPSHQLLVSCETWWYRECPPCTTALCESSMLVSGNVERGLILNGCVESEVYPITPQYYGLSCKLKIPRLDPKMGYDCIGSDGDNWEQLWFGPKVLKYSRCKKNDDSQVWHIQSVGQEWPDYYPKNKDNQKNLIDPKRNPRDLFKACTLEKKCSTDG